MTKEMNRQEIAHKIYLSITSYADYSEMNGIEREWFHMCIAKGLLQYAKEHSELAFDAGKEYGFYDAHNANAGDIPDKDEYINKHFTG